MWCVWLLSVLAAICFRHDGVTENSWSHCGWVWSGLVGGWSSTMCGLRDYSTRTEPQQRRSQTPKVVIYTFYLIGVNHTCCASLAQQNTCLFMQRIKGVLCLCVWNVMGFGWFNHLDIISVWAINLWFAQFVTICPNGNQLDVLKLNISIKFK